MSPNEDENGNGPDTPPDGESLLSQLIGKIDAAQVDSRSTILEVRALKVALTKLSNQVERLDAETLKTQLGVFEALTLLKAQEKRIGEAAKDAEQAKREAERASRPDEAELADREALREMAKVNVGTTRELAKLEHSDRLVERAQWRIRFDQAAGHLKTPLLVLIGAIVTYIITRYLGGTP